MMVPYSGIENTERSNKMIELLKAILFGIVEGITE